MAQIILENLPLFTLAAILAGSFLGSSKIYLGNGHDPRQSDLSQFDAAGWRPDTREKQTVYRAAAARSGPQGERRGPGILATLLILGILGGAGYVGYFAYKSPWSTQTDVRHLAASLHCDLAERVGMMGANLGEPGYHARNDRDGNGVACEVYGPTTLLNIATVQSTSLGTIPLAFPAQ